MKQSGAIQRFVAGLVLIVAVLSGASVSPVPAGAADRFVYWIDRVAATRGSEGFQFWGWVFDSTDPGRSLSVALEVRLASGAPVTLYQPVRLAADARPDVAAAFPQAGAAHGFYFTEGQRHAGRMTLCLRDVATGLVIGCRVLDVPSSPPRGWIDSVSSPYHNSLQVKGWFQDDPQPGTLYPGSAPTGLVLSLDGAERQIVLRDATHLLRSEDRPDVPPRPQQIVRGFDVLLPYVSAGAHTICARVDNAGPIEQPPADWAGLGCRTITVPGPQPGSPIGAFDQLAITSHLRDQGVFARLRGWAHDPDGPVAVRIVTPTASLPVAPLNVPRPDVAAAILGVPSTVGFDRILSEMPLTAPNPPNTFRGRLPWCAVAVNNGPGSDTLLGCVVGGNFSDAVEPLGPYGFGYVDALTVTGPGTIRLAGWGRIRNSFPAGLDAGSTSAVVQLDGQAAWTYTVGSNNLARPDVVNFVATLPDQLDIGNGAGFDGTASGLPSGQHQACVYLVSDDDPRLLAPLTCRMLTIS